MGLRVGERIGAFEILGPLGAGGMGEVYRAHDSRLGREIAIKVLPDSVSRHPDRLARFDREARLLASLNHPGIGAIYGLEESASGPLLILELVPGATLQERIDNGPIPLEEALSIGRQIAAAVAYAHANGIVHRDLKPANIKCAPGSVVKVLDFGLAKALAPSSALSQAAASTMTVDQTDAGAVLGSPGYMSPEQARGDEVDRRADIWAFGCILYAMLTGRAPFSGRTVADTLAAVMNTDPDWSALPPRTPEAVRRLLRRCLHKDRDRRWHDMADVRIELEEALVPGAPEEASALSDPRGWLPAETAAVATLVLVGAVNILFLVRLVPDLAASYSEVGLELSRGLRGYLWFTTRAPYVLGTLAVLWVATLYLTRVRLSAAFRRTLLAAVATLAAAVTMFGLYFVAEGALIQTFRLGLASGASAQVLRRDLVALYLASGEPRKAIALIDPDGTRDDFATNVTWQSPGQAMQLAEAHRAAGNIDAARRLYQRAQEAAVAFDQELSERVRARYLRLQGRYAVDLEQWLPATSEVRELPDLIRTVSQRRLNELNAPKAP